MDWTNVMIAVISLIGTFGGSALGIRQSNKVVELRINALEKKVDQHNNLVERMALAEKDIKEHDHRIHEIEAVLPRVPIK